MQPKSLATRGTRWWPLLCPTCATKARRGFPRNRPRPCNQMGWHISLEYGQVSRRSQESRRKAGLLYRGIHAQRSGSQPFTADKHFGSPRHSGSYIRALLVSQPGYRARLKPVSFGSHRLPAEFPLSSPHLRRPVQRSFFGHRKTAYARLSEVRTCDTRSTSLSPTSPGRPHFTPSNHPSPRRTVFPC